MRNIMNVIRKETIIILEESGSTRRVLVSY